MSSVHTPSGPRLLCTCVGVLAGAFTAINVSPTANAAFVGVIGSSSRLQLQIRTDIDDPLTHRVFTSPDLRTALWEGVSMGPDGAIYAADLGGTRFVRFDPVSETFTELPALGMGIRDLAFDPIERKLLMVNTSSQLFEIDPSTSTRTLIGALTGGTGVWGLSVAADGTRFAFNTSGRLFQLDGLQLTPIRDYGTFANGLAIDWTGSQRHFITSDSGVALREISTTSNSITTVSGFTSLDGGQFFPSPGCGGVLCVLALAIRRRRGTP